MNAKLNIGLLQSLVGSGEGGVDFRLDIFCLVNQSHELPDQDIPFFVHQAVA